MSPESAPTATKTRVGVEWAERLRPELQAEVVERQDRNASERDFLTRKLTKLEAERRKLLNAYYADAIDVPLLRAEQERISKDVASIEGRLAGVDSTLGEWREILDIAMRSAASCGTA